MSFVHQFKLFILNTSKVQFCSICFWCHTLFFILHFRRLHFPITFGKVKHHKLTFTPARSPISINQSGALPFKHSSARLHLHGPCGLGRWGLSEVIAGNWWMPKRAIARASVREPLRRAIPTRRTEVTWRRRCPLNGNLDICHESIKGIQTNGRRLPREPVFLRQTLVTA